MGNEQPTDYPPAPRRQKDCAKFPWIPVGGALLIPLFTVVIWAVTLGNRLDAVAQDVEDNGKAIATTPSTFVPRNELDAKLENIDTKVNAVQADVTELKRQGEQQTAEIIRRIERMDTPRRTP